MLGTCIPSLLLKMCSQGSHPGKALAHRQNSKQMRRKGKNVIHKVVQLLFIMREQFFKVSKGFRRECQTFQGTDFSLNRKPEEGKEEVLNSVRFRATGIETIVDTVIQPREREGCWMMKRKQQQEKHYYPLSCITKEVRANYNNPKCLHFSPKEKLNCIVILDLNIVLFFFQNNIKCCPVRSTLFQVSGLNGLKGVQVRALYEEQ